MTKISAEAHQAAFDIWAFPRLLNMAAQTERRERIIQQAIDAATEELREKANVLAGLVESEFAVSDNSKPCPYCDLSVGMACISCRLLEASSRLRFLTNTTPRDTSGTEGQPAIEYHIVPPNELIAENKTLWEKGNNLRWELMLTFSPLSNVKVCTCEKESRPPCLRCRVQKAMKEWDALTAEKQGEADEVA